MVGSELGHYKILSALGAGGMGEVYLADDTKLDRQVAIKVLPESLRKDDTRLERFRREARASASLKHPNIATIYSIEDVGDVLFIVMEYVEGKTLAEHIPSGGMELEDFFSVFLPLADALAHAHENGRIHRDIKPGNIMLTGDGTPRILDFGLARIEQEGGDVLESDTPTLTMKEMPPSLTQGRSFLGTPAYMSPEQIEGGKVDARTDIFSFGVVMYEALTGQRPFKGDTVESVIARILEIDPAPATELKPTSPYMLWQVIRKCLVKDRDRRMQSGLELHHELESVQAEMETGRVLVDASTIPAPQAADVAPTEPAPFWLRPAAIATLIVFALIIGGGATLLFRSSPEFSVRKFRWSVQNIGQSVIAPDGNRIAYITGGRLWIKDLDQVKAREIQDSDGVTNLFWSPHSDFVGYHTPDELRKVSATGGPSITIAKTSYRRGTNASWGPDGTIILTQVVQGRVVLSTVSDQGGEPAVYMQPDSTAGEQGYMNPHVLPDGRTLLFTVRNQEGNHNLVVQSGGRRQMLVQDIPGFPPRPIYDSSGHIVYNVFNKRSYNIWAAPFDVSNLMLTGEPFLVAEQASGMSVSRDGTLLYLTYPYARVQLSWVDRRGTVTDTIGLPSSTVFHIELSPDEQQVAATNNDVRATDTWIYDVERGTRIRLTSGPRSGIWPTWSPEGDAIVYSGGGGLRLQTIQGTVQDSLLTGENGPYSPFWSWDGRTIVFSRNGPETGRDIWQLPMTGDPGPRPVLQGPYQEHTPILSPNGRYLAYVSDESGQWEVYVTRFPSGIGKWKVSTNGGDQPRWRGDEVFYLELSRMMVAQVESGSEVRIGPARSLFSRTALRGKISGLPGGIRNYDVSRDGQRFVLAAKVEESLPTVTVVQNWIKEFPSRE
jgi:eukaryotic-like serine/threonine-protein kinase